MTREEAIHTVKTTKDWSELREALAVLVPELAESKDERMLKKLIEGFKIYIRDIRYFNDIDVLDILNFLEKQKNKKYEMIQWTGDNLKEVFKFTGKSPMFEKWFKSWEQYEEYVHSHENIFKLFNEDGSHYEVPVGAWIVKTPDGYNTPSRFRFIQKPTEWSEGDERIIKDLLWICDGLEQGYNDFFHKKEKYAEIRSFLKSLRPQPKWKPTEEQIYSLGTVVKGSGECSVGSVGYNLKTLYNELKQLK